MPTVDPMPELTGIVKVQVVSPAEWNRRKMIVAQIGVRCLLDAERKKHQ